MESVWADRCSIFRPSKITSVFEDHKNTLEFDVGGGRVGRWLMEKREPGGLTVFLLDEPGVMGTDQISPETNF